MLKACLTAFENIDIGLEGKWEYCVYRIFHVR
jgi:hypothetical protein